MSFTEDLLRIRQEQTPEQVRQQQVEQAAQRIEQQQPMTRLFLSGSQRIQTQHAVEAPESKLPNRIAQAAETLQKMIAPIRAQETAKRDQEAGYKRTQQLEAVYNPQAAERYSKEAGQKEESAMALTRQAEELRARADALSGTRAQQGLALSLPGLVRDTMTSAQAKALEANLREMEGQERDLRTQADEAERQGQVAKWSAERDAQRAEYLKWVQPYMELTKEPDFQAAAKYETEATGKDGGLLKSIATKKASDLVKWKNPLYEAINGNEAAAQALYGKAIATGRAADGEDRRIAQMTQQEKQIYNYLYNTRGLIQANKYYSELSPELNARASKKEAEWAEGLVQSGPLGAIAGNVLSVAMAPLRGGAYLLQLADAIGKGEVDPNAGYNRLSQIPSAIREATGETINQTLGDTWGKWGNFGYQTLMSIADFLTTTAVSGGFGASAGAAEEWLNLGLMGTGAAADAVIEARERGVDTGAALVIGTVAGAAEMITEKISLETLLDPDLLADGKLRYILKNVLAEGSEEGASDLINFSADALYETLTHSGKSELQTRIRGLMEQGHTRPEATGIALGQKAEELGLSVLGGALSGGVMAGGNALLQENSAGGATMPQDSQTRWGEIEKGEQEGEGLERKQEGPGDKIEPGEVIQPEEPNEREAEHAEATADRRPENGVAAEPAEGNGGERAGEETQRQPAKAAERQRAVRAEAIAQTETKALGIQEATSAERVTALPEELWDDEIRQTADFVRRETGATAVFVMGGLPFQKTDGSQGLARGAIVGNRIVLQADNMTYGVEQIARHEMWHALAARAPAMNQEVLEKINARFGDAELEAVVDRYIDAFEGVIDIPDLDLGGQAFQKAYNQIMEEIFADAYAGMNAFQAGAPKFREEARETRARYWGAEIGQEASGVRFSLEDSGTEDLKQDLWEKSNVDRRMELREQGEQSGGRETPLGKNDSARQEIKKELNRRASQPGKAAAVQAEMNRLRDADYQQTVLKERGAKGIAENERKIRRLQERLDRMTGKAQRTREARMEELQGEIREKREALKGILKEEGTEAYLKEVRQLKRLQEQLDRMTGKQPQEGKTAPTIAQKDLQEKILKIFSVPNGARTRNAAYVKHVADEIYQRGTVTDGDVDRVFDHMMEEGVVVQKADEYSRTQREAVAGGKIYCSPDTKAEFGEDWNSFRKRAWAAGVYLVNDSSARAPDQWNVSLAESFPGTFDAGETDVRTVLERIVQIAEEGKAEHMTLEESIARMAGEEYVTEDEILQSMRTSTEYALRAFCEKAGLEVKLKTERNQAVLKERQQAAERRRKELENQRERRERAELKERLDNRLQWLWSHRQQAPDALRPAWDEVLSGVDLYASSVARSVGYSRRYDMSYRDIADFIAEKTDPSSQGYDPSFQMSDGLQKIWDKAKPRLASDPKSTSEMSLGEMQELYNAVVALETEWEARKRLLDDEMDRTLSEMYYNIRDELKGVKGKTLDTVADRMLTPANRLLKMSRGKEDSALYSLAKMLEAGERKTRKFQADAEAAIDRFAQEHREWFARADGQGKDGIWYSREVSPVTEWGKMDQPIFGKPVTVWFTPLQKVQMYLESKGEDNLRHMRGGRVFVNKDLYQKGKTREAYGQGAKRIMMDERMVQGFVENMTNEEKALADLLERYYNRESRDEINRVSNILYGWNKAMNRYYAPITTDPLHVGTTIGTFDITAEGAGNLKTRVKSWTPSLNVSALDAFQRSVAQTSRFVGMAIPVRNITALLNYEQQDAHENYNLPLKKMLNDAWAGSPEMIRELTEELQGNLPSKTPKADQFLDNALSKYITSVFGLNPSIVAKQVMSYPLAGAYLGWRNLTLNLPRAAHVNMDLINKYTGELAYRSKGMATPELALLKKNPGKLDTNPVLRFALRGGAIGWMDNFTTRTLWSAAENKVRRETDLRPGPKAASGDDPFYQKVAEEYENALSRSQPMYDVMHRADIMRNGGPLMRALTLFKTVPMQEYNMLAEHGIKIRGELERMAEAEKRLSKLRGELEKAEGEERGRLQQEIERAETVLSETRSRKKRAAQGMGSTILGILSGTMGIGAINFLNALWKNKAKKYREDDELTAESILSQFGRGFLRDMAGIVIGGGEIVDILAAIFGDQRWYGIDTPGIEQITEIVEALIDAGANAKKLAEDSAEIMENGGDWGRYMRKNGQAYVKSVEKITSVLARYGPGLPWENFKAYFLGAAQWVSPEIKTAYEDALKKATKGSLDGLHGDALNMRLQHLLENRDLDLDEQTVDRFAELYEAGKKGAIPSDVPEKATINGEERQLNIAQQQTWQNIWNGVVQDALPDILEAGLEDEDLENALKKLYTYANEKTKEAIFEDYESNSKAMEDVIQGGASVAEAAQRGAKGELEIYSRWQGSEARKKGIEADVFVDFWARKSELKSDKNENGETISGSLKGKVLELIDSMKISNAQKDALYYDAGYKGTTIAEAPWRNRLSFGG